MKAGLHVVRGAGRGRAFVFSSSVSAAETRRRAGRLQSCMGCLGRDDIHILYQATAIGGHHGAVETETEHAHRRGSFWVRIFFSSVRICKIGDISMSRAVCIDNNGSICLSLVGLLHGQEAVAQVKLTCEVDPAALFFGLSLQHLCSMPVALHILVAMSCSCVML